MSANRVVVRLRPGCSDGDATHIPKPGKCTQVDPPTLYLEKIGQQWMEERGEARAGVKYILDSLPPGYTMWQRPREKSPTHVDKYLYGHPGHKAFDSPNRFFPHFLHLMQNSGNNIGCPCTVCSGSSGELPKTSPSSSIPSSTPSTRPTIGDKPASSFPGFHQTLSLQTKASNSANPQHVQALQVSRLQPTPTASPAPQPQSKSHSTSAGMSTIRTDEQGTPDVYRNLIERLRRNNVIDETIEEHLSPDWKAEQAILPHLLQELKTRGQWVPRAGDVVLYVRELPQGVDIVRNNATGVFKLYDEKTRRYIGSPDWEAGLVGQTPTETTTIDDIIEDGDKPANVTYSGIRVEPLPNVNWPDKSLSKRHKYLPIRQIRPFILWKELLHQIPQEQWHPTITNALTITATFSLMGKHRFRGTWPKAQIYCHGLHLGYEMLAVGDVVRLLPITRRNQTECLDILVIKSIRLEWTNLDKASTNDWDDGHPYNSSVWIHGSAYTSDASFLNKEWLSDTNVEPPRVADGYSTWYPLHPASKELRIPLSRILGRLYERFALALWLNSSPSSLPGLDPGRESLLQGLAYARKHDRRILDNPGSTWYWGDSRADALDLHTINGLDVAKHDPERRTKEWQEKIDQLRRIERQDAKPAVSLGLRRFMAPGTDQPSARTQPSRRTDDSASGTSTAASEAGVSVVGKKRPRVVNLCSDDDDDNDNDNEGGNGNRNDNDSSNSQDDDMEREIRESTKIIREGNDMDRKKTKVQIVID